MYLSTERQPVAQLSPILFLAVTKTGQFQPFPNKTVEELVRFNLNGIGTFRKLELSITENQPMETLAYIHAAEAYEAATAKSTSPPQRRQHSQPVLHPYLETCIIF